MYGFVGNDGVNYIDLLGKDNYSGNQNAPPVRSSEVTLPGSPASNAKIKIGDTYIYVATIVTINIVGKCPVTGSTESAPLITLSPRIGTERIKDNTPPGIKCYSKCICSVQCKCCDMTWSISWYSGKIKGVTEAVSDISSPTGYSGADCVLKEREIKKARARCKRESKNACLGKKKLIK